MKKPEHFNFTVLMERARFYQAHPEARPPAPPAVHHNTAAARHGLQTR